MNSFVLAIVSQLKIEEFSTTFEHYIGKVNNHPCNTQTFFAHNKYVENIILQLMSHYFTYGMNGNEIK